MRLLDFFHPLLVKELYAQDRGSSSAGRPHWPVVLFSLACLITVALPEFFQLGSTLYVRYLFTFASFYMLFSAFVVMSRTSLACVLERCENTYEILLLSNLGPVSYLIGKTMHGLGHTMKVLEGMGPVFFIGIARFGLNFKQISVFLLIFTSSHIALAAAAGMLAAGPLDSERLEKRLGRPLTPHEMAGHLAMGLPVACVFVPAVILVGLLVENPDPSNMASQVGFESAKILFLWVPAILFYVNEITLFDVTLPLSLVFFICHLILAGAALGLGSLALRHQRFERFAVRRPIYLVLIGLVLFLVVGGVCRPNGFFIKGISLLVAALLALGVVASKVADPPWPAIGCGESVRRARFGDALRDRSATAPLFLILSWMVTTPFFAHLWVSGIQEVVRIDRLEFGLLLSFPLVFALAVAGFAYRPPQIEPNTTPRRFFSYFFFLLPLISMVVLVNPVLLTGGAGLGLLGVFVDRLFLGLSLTNPFFCILGFFDGCGGPTAGVMGPVYRLAGGPKPFFFESLAFFGAIATIGMLRFRWTRTRLS